MRMGVFGVWRTVYRLDFPLARFWWWLRRSRHEGALVAVYVDRALLLVRSSYRKEWNSPVALFDAVRPLKKAPDASRPRE
jgi:8-oxo-dGTP diphosphatase